MATFSSLRVFLVSLLGSSTAADAAAVAMILESRVFASLARDAQRGGLDLKYGKSDLSICESKKVTDTHHVTQHRNFCRCQEQFPRHSYHDHDLGNAEPHSPLILPIHIISVLEIHLHKG
jgi:hypothetical protein